VDGTGIAQKEGYRWVVLVIAYLLMFLFALPLQAVPPMLDQIGKDIPLSNSMAGLLMGAYGIPGFFMPVAAAILASRYDKKNLTVVALVVMAAGLVLFSLSVSYPMLLTARLLSGLGAKVILSLAPLLVILFFQKDNLATIIGVFNTAVPLGSIVSMNFFGYIGRIIGWRGATLILALLTMFLVVLVRFALFIPVEHERRDHDLQFNRREMDARIWLLALVNFLINVVTLAYITFAPHFFTATGYTPAESNLMASLVMIETAALGPAAGYLIDRRDLKKPIIAAGSIIMAASFPLLCVWGHLIPLWVVLLGIGAAVVPVVVFPLLRDVLKPHQFSMGIAILIIASNLGSTTGPVVFGWLIDYSGYPAGFGLLAVLSLMIVPVIWIVGAGPGTAGAGVKKKLLPKTLDD
jgi:predicted MFS family arabinose efflux permease